MERAVTELQIGLDNVLDDTQDGVFIVDKERRVLLFNRACERLTGYSRREVLGTQCHCHEITDCQDEYGRSLMGRLCPGVQVFKGELPATRQRMRISRRDGSHVWAETSYTPLKDDDGEVTCVLAVVRDISDLKRIEDELSDTTDDLRAEVERLRGEIRQRYGFSTIVSRNPKMEAIFERIRAAGTNNGAVLISGEAGTGKEIIARTIHYNGLQKDGPFVPLNCSALTPELMESELFGHVRGAFAGAHMDYDGLFRAAEGGTIFLDEIAAMPAELQAKLLRVLDDKRLRQLGSTREVAVNVRVIASTNRVPAEAVSTGELRKDLFYRLGVIAIQVPPLRERKEDIPFLVEHFIAQFNRQSVRQVKGVASDVWPALLRYEWNGNVRELQNAVESAFAVGSGPELKTADLPELIRGEVIEIRRSTSHADMPLDEVLASVERQAILAALRRAGGQRSRAARAIAISRSRLYRRMEALGIRPREDL